MVDVKCVRQRTIIQPQIAGLVTTYDKADMSSKSASIRLQPSIINEETTRNKMEANTAIRVVKTIKRGHKQWAVINWGLEEHLAYKSACIILAYHF